MSKKPEEVIKSKHITYIERRKRLLTKKNEGDQNVKNKNDPPETGKRWRG